MKKQICIYTVGHSSQSIESFLNLIETHGITAIADVRSSPYSRHAPHFNRDDLSKSLAQSNITYVYLGEQLGARSENETCYVNGVVNYQRLSETSSFKLGIERVLNGSKRFNIALMCSEREPTECHRTILISRVLERWNVDVFHILGDASLEKHQDTMLRLLDILGTPRSDLYNTTEELIQKAYVEREKQIAYRREG